MSSLTEIEKRYFEKMCSMGGGYVLDFTDWTFAEFFEKYSVDIHSVRYQRHGTSKAKKLRAFWEIEPDSLVGRVLDDLIGVYVATCELSNKDIDSLVVTRCKETAGRLLGRAPSGKGDEAIFLEAEFKFPSLDRLPIDGSVLPIIEARLAEAKRAMGAGAFLSVIFLSGSVLEGVLLGAAQAKPSDFNRATASPKDKSGGVKRFHEWSLREFIDVATEIGMLKADVQKFSHGLRDFRNYIHPYEQLVSGFTPDEHTAKVCFQVLKAGLASLAGIR